ncbi:MAG: hypothetical protein NPMRTHETA2_490009 [Nitrosopumilales archaeon]|nr:MAG: hypothetical protein NPMRTHETA2_490009 [Nitrosopumilales archaeon]
MDLSQNVLSEGQKTYLESQNLLYQKSKSQHRKNIINNIKDSICYLNQVFPFSNQLKKESFYDKINALTLIDILQNSLLDIELEGGEYRSKKYDFRTVELARMMFHVSTNYLMNSSMYREDETVIYDVKHVARHFRILAKSKLDDVSHGTLKESKERELKEKLEVIRKAIEYEKYNQKEPYQKHDKEYGQLVDKRRELDNTYQELQARLKEEETRKTQKVDLDVKKLDKTISKTKKQIKENREMDNQLLQQILKVQEQRNSILRDKKEEEHRLSKILDSKFNHLKWVFCPFDPLEPFADKMNPHYLKDHPKNKYLLPWVD